MRRDGFWGDGNLLGFGMVRSFAPILGTLVMAVAVQAQNLNEAPKEAPLLVVRGVGAQVYRCDATTSTWVLDHPDADLVDKGGKVVGHHDAGPSWHYQDGSSVQGAVIGKADATEAGAIPWLELRATGSQGTGVLSRVGLIRRTETHGGVAPTSGCKPGDASLRVPYSATYSFYGRP